MVANSAMGKSMRAGARLWYRLKEDVNGSAKEMCLIVRRDSTYAKALYERIGMRYVGTIG